jgi:hypothetical protein
MPHLTKSKKKSSPRLRGGRAKCDISKRPSCYTEPGNPKKNTKNPQIVFVKSTNTPKYTKKPTNTHDREEIGPSVIYQNDPLATTTQEIQFNQSDQLASLSD